MGPQQSAKCTVIFIRRRNVDLAMGKYDWFILNFGSEDGSRLHIIDKIGHSEKAQRVSLSYLND